MILTNVCVIPSTEGMLFPKRATEYSAGYDVFAPNEIKISPKSSYEMVLPFSFKKDETENDMEILLLPRSSYGIKKKLRLLEGSKVAKHISVPISNQSFSITLWNDSDEELCIPKNEHFLQCVLVNKKDTRLPANFFTVSKETQENFPPHPFEIQEGNKSYSLINLKKFEIQPKEQIMLPTGWKSSFDRGSWMGATISKKFEESLIFSNLTPVIDADYYNNNSNEGLIFISLVNQTNETITVEENDDLLSFWCKPFYLLANDVPTNEKRKGGIGSSPSNSNNK